MKRKPTASALFQLPIIDMLIPILMLAGAGVVAGLLLTRKGHRHGSLVTTVAAVIGLGAGAYRVLWGEGGEDEHPVKVSEAHFAAIAAERLGLHLAEQHAGASAIVVLPFEFRASAEHRAAMEAGFRRGIADKITVVKTIDPPLPPNVRLAYQSRYHSADMEQIDVPDFASWYTAAYFDATILRGAVVEKGGDPVSLVICLGGLPEDAAKLALLKTSPRPKLAMVFGPIHALHPMIARGEIIAAIEHSPAPNHQALPPKEDVVTAFDRRYLLITPQNLAEMKQRVPKLY